MANNVLEVKYTDWKCKHADIIDETSSRVLSKVEFKMRKPHLFFTSAEDNTPFGKATLHTFTSRIDIELHGQTIELKPKKWTGREYIFTSPVLRNSIVTWRCNSSWKFFDYTLLDENSLPIARCYVPNLASWKTAAKIELSEPYANNPTLRDEVFITGLTLGYWKTIMNNTAIVAAVS